MFWVLDAYAAKEPLQTQSILVLDEPPPKNRGFQSQQEREVLLLEKPGRQTGRCRRQFWEGRGRGPWHQAIIG